MSKTGYLGPEGSYSQLAANQLGCGSAAVAYPSFYALIAALNGGEVDAIVLPVENSLNGGVMQNLDLLHETQGVIAVREAMIKIEHRLITLKGADLDGITTIYSHPQALGQCSKYIHSRFPAARLVPTQSTSACISKITTTADAGIIGLQPVDDRFELSEESISDELLNYTQFLYVVKGQADVTRHSRKIFLSVTCAHRPGALTAVLSVFARDDINMTKIESRPIKDRVGEYRFFIEVEADYSSTRIRSVLRSLSGVCGSVKILGCY